MQDCGISNVFAMDTLQSKIKPLERTHGISTFDIWLLFNSYKTATEKTPDSNLA